MKLIPQGLTQKVGRQLLIIRKNSPRSLFVVGMVGTVTSTVLACRATMKLDETLDDFKNDIDSVKDKAANIPAKFYDRNQYNKDLARVYMQGTYKLTKLYAPALLIGGASLSALTGSHVTLTRRNTSLTAAYSALQMSYDAYRERVRQELNGDKELDIYHAIYKEDETVDGKIKELRKADPNRWSPYAKFFDEYNQNWQKSPEFNRIFIQAQQNYVNHLLQARGHVFLNEVYDQLGFDHTQAGAVVGWVIGQGGDNYIDFGMFENVSSKFVNGWERSIILDFNVDGVIYDKI